MALSSSGKTKASGRGATTIQNWITSDLNSINFSFKLIINFISKNGCGNRRSSGTVRTRRETPSSAASTPKHNQLQSWTSDRSSSDGVEKVVTSNHPHQQLQLQLRLIPTSGCIFCERQPQELNKIKLQHQQQPGRSPELSRTSIFKTFKVQDSKIKTKKRPKQTKPRWLWPPPTQRKKITAYRHWKP